MELKLVLELVVGLPPVEETEFQKLPLQEEEEERWAGREQEGWVRPSLRLVARGLPPLLPSGSP